MNIQNLIYKNVIIVAVGGGGFTHQSDPELEDFILAQCQARHPRVGYIGAASRDDANRIDLFYRRFEGIARSTSHLLQSATTDIAQDWATRQDIIYIGGGDTLHLLRWFEKNGLDAILKTVANAGTVLAGVSAGAACWHEFALSNSAGNGLRPLSGLGFVAGSCCPHYSSEPERQPVFREYIANGSMPGGLAIDDGVAVLIRPDEPPLAFSARKGAGAHRVENQGNKCVVKPVALV